MISIRTFLKGVAVFILGIFGAFIFVLFLLPLIISSPYFGNFSFVKNFKQGKIEVKEIQQIYIQENMALENAIKNFQKSVVAILRNGQLAGAGLVATSDGTVITLASIIPAANQTTILLDGKAVSFNVEKRDYKNNLALIKISKENLETVAFADTNKILLGQRVFLTAPKTAKGDVWFANEGILRSFENNFIKTNIAEVRIASGAPLFNISGELVGISFLDADGKISAVSLATIKSFLGI